MSQSNSSPDGEEADGEGSRRGRSAARNIVGISLAFMFIVAGAFGWAAARKPDLEVNCEKIRETEIESSRLFVLSSLDSEISALDAELADAGRDLAAAVAVSEDLDGVAEMKQTQVADLRRASLESKTVADVAAEDDGTSAKEQQQLGAAEDDAEARLATAVAEADAAEAERRNASEVRATHEGTVERLEATREQKSASLVQVSSAEVDGDGRVTTQRVAARSQLTFEPDVSVAKIHFGSNRDAKRVEVALTVKESPGDPGAAVGAVQSHPMPDVFWLVAETDQLRRNSGLEVPAEQVMTWARRYGDQLFVSVCINPESSLDAGRYVGSINVADPSVQPVSIPIEITAQTSLINWILITLLLSPILAFLFVWVKFRHSADMNPAMINLSFWSWAKPKHGSPRPKLFNAAFLRWASANFILAFVIGFAAVWATLQVPLSNDTFGDSVVQAGAAVGVTLVAAVGAITPVVGRVRGPEIDRKRKPEPKSD